MAEARVVSVVKLPWYRRIFGGREKQPKQYAAGQRIDSMSKSAPKGGKGIGGIVKGIGLVRGLMVLVVAVGVFGYIGIPSVQGVVNGFINTVRTEGITGVVDKISSLVNPQTQIERPTAATASSFVDGHEAQLAFDGFFDTDWQATDKVPTITATFGAPFDLKAVYVYPGDAKTFTDFRRPSKLEFEFPDGTKQTVDLEDVKDKQLFKIEADKVDRIIIRVIEMKGPETAPLAISEIEFFKPKVN